MSNMHRTQIYINEEEMRILRIEAKNKYITVSELIREAIRKHLLTKEKRLNWKNDPLTKAVGKIKSKTKDASIRHDDYLYG
ncbi:CopG family transcriptional regulator [Candidatus Auribacterota bacterium]